MPRNKPRNAPRSLREPLRLSELLGLDVVDPAGERVGSVADVRLVRDGPPQGLGLARLRVAGLVVSPRHGGRLLGYERTPLEGPWLVRTLVMAFNKGTHYLPWEWVDGVEDGVVRTSRPASDLPPVPPLER
jgi:sporulation protein YlmC with PRC-barrel domain